MSEGNMIWILICGTLVMFMQAGFAMLETGFVRAKNAGNIVMKNVIDVSIGVPMFWIVGFGLMYGQGNGLFGELDLFVRESYETVLPSGISLPAFIFYQAAFCATAATIVSGAMAERTKFSAYCVYSVVMSMLIYPCVGHWIWGGGWLAELGFHDFAGGTAVHTLGGMAAFAGASLLGPRMGKYASDGSPRAILGHNIPLSTLGLMILWFGWYGFNGGSVLTAKGTLELQTVGTVFLNTSIAAATSGTVSMITSKIKFKKPDVGMTLNGILAGLVVSTAGCDRVSPFGACSMGILSGIVVVLAITFIDRVLKVDDPVGAIGVHGFCGMLGTILTGLFAVDEGLFYTGSAEFFLIQLLGSVVVAVFVFVIMTMVFFLIRSTIGLRVDEKTELAGLDGPEYGLASAYSGFVISDYADLLSGETELPSADIEEAVPIHLSCGTQMQCGGLSKVEILTKQSRFDALKNALNEIGVTGMTVSQVVGCGMQKGQSEYYRGAQMDVHLLPKIKVEIVLAKVPVEEVVNTARRVLYTGHIGDGKIFVYDVKNVVKIRTGEVDYDAMQGTTE